MIQSVHEAISLFGAEDDKKLKVIVPLLEIAHNFTMIICIGDGHIIILIRKQDRI
jgi:hypothetical protein